MAIENTRMSPWKFKFNLHKGEFKLISFISFSISPSYFLIFNQTHLKLSSQGKLPQNQNIWKLAPVSGTTYSPYTFHWQILWLFGCGVKIGKYGLWYMENATGLMPHSRWVVVRFRPDTESKGPLQGFTWGATRSIMDYWFPGDAPNYRQKIAGLIILKSMLDIPPPLFFSF